MDNLISVAVFISLLHTVASHFILKYNNSRVIVYIYWMQFRIQQLKLLITINHLPQAQTARVPLVRKPSIH